jgi:hypothetical protein
MKVWHCTALLSAMQVAAWGFEGHRLTGAIAQHFLNDHSRAILNVLLPQYNGNITNVTTWADEVKRDPEFNFSANLHFVATQDDAPRNCSYNDDRDCKDRFCIVGAIANYTSQAVCQNGVVPNRYQQEVAIKFLTHFAGDISQPLHVCGREQGGNNKTQLLFDGQRVISGFNTTLHGFWDFTFIQKDLRLNFNDDEGILAQKLINDIRFGKYRAMRDSWISNRNIMELSPNGNSMTAIDWATDANGISCQIVWDDFDRDLNQDFGGAYFEKALPVVYLQVAKAGFRMADFINKVLGTCPISAYIQTNPTTSATFNARPTGYVAF